ncbi:hypothetical protein BV25DRAFT_710203 [Artomyces pyxidatus]|uniref:Uncharacterized protein n=1 Tax=Artomyces pyxidatus TaxID=48021 RepID=A0ACB8SZH8_9AGAM|nr:hypothetical protein BV25DRAFT_710203 [Artomyces pyxidatus]
MPATRTKDSQKAESSTDALSKTPKQKSQKKEAAVPGVSKLKSALRQTRRLLAKDTLAANVRVETERRLKALEADLAKAETSKKERSLAVKYHKIKFFDRQKIVRKIRQTQKLLEDPDLSSKPRKSLNSALFELRVDLNYNYPKTEKYISLFPPDVRHDGSSEPVHQATDPAHKTVRLTDAKREEVRDWVKGRMKAGDFSAEPEVLVKRDEGDGADAWEKSKHGLEDKITSKKAKAKKGLEDDDFFEAGNGEGDVSDEGILPSEPAPSPPKEARKFPGHRVREGARLGTGSDGSHKRRTKPRGADASVDADEHDGFFAEAT